MTQYLAPEKPNPNPAVTPQWILRQKGKQKITMLTAYEYSFSKWIDEAGVDLILVGDSVWNVVYGESTTLGATMDGMMPHVKAVTKAAKRALVVADMPFMSYQADEKDALMNAGRFLKEGGAQAVKLEGGKEIVHTVAKLVSIGIPVVAHIGLMPQRIRAMGNYRTFGKTDTERSRLIEEAKTLESAGAFAIVLECIEPGLSAEISQELLIPTIGIGSGDGCDGQVLVTQDLLGLGSGHVPKFVSPTQNLAPLILNGIKAFIDRTKQ